MVNVFENPTKYLRLINKIKLVDVTKERDFPGKSIAVVFITKFCNAKCKFCIYKSPMLKGNETSRDSELDDIGIIKTIEFINKANIGYLLVSRWWRTIS